jgi:uncharacterized protein (TIGR00645 family)
MALRCQAWCRIRLWLILTRQPGADSGLLADSRRRMPKSDSHRFIGKEILTNSIMERIFENLLYASRWVLAPIYLGLSAALLLLGLKFFQEVVHAVPLVIELKEADLVLLVLSLVDMALVGGLLVMVMLSGYENFVSRIDVAEDAEKLSWLGKLDSGSLKQKVAASIVAISSIHLLKAFMNAQQIGNDKLMWYVIIHLTFVLSALGMAYVDKMNKS